jgi:hypothetical protein
MGNFSLGGTLILVGVVCMIVAVIGGGLKLKDAEFPTIHSVRRQTMLGVLGLLIALAGWGVDHDGLAPPKETVDEQPAPVPSSSGGQPSTANATSSLAKSAGDHPSPARKALADCARKEVGTQEEGGENRGPRIDQYADAVSAPRGLPWSGTFISFCIREAGLADDLTPSPSIQALLRSARAQEWDFKISNEFVPQEGDILVVPRGPSWSGGIVLEFLPNDKRIVLIEGNIAKPGSGSPGGIGVFERVIAVTPNMRFLRIHPEQMGSTPTEFG